MYTIIINHAFLFNVLSALVFLECHIPSIPSVAKKKWHSHIALFEKKEWHSLITLSLKEYTLLVLPFFFKKFRLKKLSNQQRIQKFEICLDVANGDVSEEKKYIKHNAIITRLIWNSISTKLVSF